MRRGASQYCGDCNEDIRIGGSIDSDGSLTDIVQGTAKPGHPIRDML